MLADYRHTSLSVGVHPLELLRPHLPPACVASDELADVPHGARIAVAGMAVARQRPSTANGIVFMLLEDEHGQMNLIIPPPVYEAHRAIVRGEPLLLARGRFERVGRNENVLVDELETPRPARPPGRRRGRGARAPCPRPTTSGTASDRAPGVLLWSRWCSSPLALVWLVVVLVWVIRKPRAADRRGARALDDGSGARARTATAGRRRRGGSTRQRFSISSANGGRRFATARLNSPRTARRPPPSSVRA